MRSILGMAPDLGHFGDAWEASPAQSGRVRAAPLEQKIVRRHSFWDCVVVHCEISTHQTPMAELPAQGSDQGHGSHRRGRAESLVSWDPGTPGLLQSAVSGTGDVPLGAESQCLCAY